MFIHSLAVALGAVVLCVYLELSGTSTTGITYRYRSVSILKYALWLLGVSTLLGIINRFSYLKVCYVSDWTHWRRIIRQLFDDDAKQDFDLLLGSQYQILCLRRRLVEAATAIDDQNKRCKILEQRLTREQLQVTRTNGHITRLVRQQPAVSALRLCAHRREIYLQMVRRGLFSYMFLWRLSRILGRKVADISVTASFREAELRVCQGECQNLRLDNIGKDVVSIDLGERLTLSENDKSKLSKQLITIHRKYIDSLHARQRNIQVSLALREKEGTRRTKTIRSMYVMVLILWRYTRYVSRQLVHHAQSIFLVKADLAVARTKYNNMKARYDTLLADCEQSCRKLVRLETAFRKQDYDINSLKTALGAAIREEVQSRSRLDELTTKYDRLQADHTILLCRSTTLETRLLRTEGNYASLASEHAVHIRSSGLAIAELAQDAYRKRARATNSLRSAQNMMVDLHLRVAAANAQLQKMMRTFDSTHIDMQPRWRTTYLPSPPPSAKHVRVRSMRASTRKPPDGSDFDRLELTSSVPLMSEVLSPGAVNPLRFHRLLL